MEKEKSGLHKPDIDLKPTKKELFNIDKSQYISFAEFFSLKWLENLQVNDENSNVFPESLRKVIAYFDHIYTLSFPANEVNPLCKIWEKCIDCEPELNKFWELYDLACLKLNAINKKPLIEGKINYIYKTIELFSMLCQFVDYNSGAKKETKGFLVKIDEKNKKEMFKDIKENLDTLAKILIRDEVCQISIGEFLSKVEQVLEK